MLKLATQNQSGLPVRYENLFAGDLAPWFRQRCTAPQASGLYSFDMAAGRHVVLCFYGSAADAPGMQALAFMQAHKATFDAASVLCFGVSLDAEDERSGRAIGTAADVRHIWDHDLAVSRRYGVVPADGAAAAADVRRAWYVLDTRLRIIAVLPFTDDGAEAVLRLVSGLSEAAAQRLEAQVPVLMVPGVFEPPFCERLIGVFDSQGSEMSAVFTEGAAVNDGAAKRRRDVRLTDDALIAQVQTRIFRRVVPEIRHAFQFHATRLERLIVACYDAADGGHFAPHRDNTLAATAHRRFAVSINLNGDFDGGGVSFPEYSARAFTPPVGGALVFSCAMLHAVGPVLRGRRYACLPFVYDEAAAELRRGAR